MAKSGDGTRLGGRFPPLHPSIIAMPSGEPILAHNKWGFFPSPPPTNLLYGLQEAIRMLEEEGLRNVFARHDRLAEATGRAGMGTRNPLCRPRRTQKLPYCGPDAGGIW